MGAGVNLAHQPADERAFAADVGVDDPDVAYDAVPVQGLEQPALLVAVVGHIADGVAVPLESAGVQVVGADAQGHKVGVDVGGGYGHAVGGEIQVSG